jgi:hypothetical protein
VYDCPRNRKAIFNCGMIPNITRNSRGRKTPKRDRKARFNPMIRVSSASDTATCNRGYHEFSIDSIYVSISPDKDGHVPGSLAA